MKKRKNPFSTRWDQSIDVSRITGQDAALYQMFEFIQTVLYCEGILIEMEPALYLSALDDWGTRYPEYFYTLQCLAMQANDAFNINGASIPVFCSRLFLTVFSDLDLMVNGETDNHQGDLRLFR